MSGTKVTSDPIGQQQPVAEGGVVADDSLAAESISAGGAYSANPVTKDSSALDTSSDPTVLEQAPNARARLEEQGSDLELGTGRDSDAATGDKSSSFAEVVDSGVSRPKGEGLSEGDFDSGAPNASFSTDIGGKNDPGRVALQRFADDNAATPSGDGVPRQDHLDTENQYEELGGETSA